MQFSIKKLFFYSLIFSIALGDDHNFNISGTVYRDGTKIPLQGANVLFVNKSGDDYGASSDENGMYFISNVPDGNYTVTIYFIGYDDYRKSVLI